jgi:hypothetical protein
MTWSGEGLQSASLPPAARPLSQPIYIGDEGFCGRGTLEVNPINCPRCLRAVPRGRAVLNSERPADTDRRDLPYYRPRARNLEVTVSRA